MNRKSVGKFKCPSIKFQSVNLALMPYKVLLKNLFPEMVPIMAK